MSHLDVASMRLVVSREMLQDQRLSILNYMREKIARDIHAIAPGTRIHWCFSKVYPRCYDLTGIASLDDRRALSLAQKMRYARRHTHGYRSFMDEMEDNHP